MKALRIYKKYGMYILLVIEILIFAVAAPNFLSVNNLFNVLRQVSMLGNCLMRTDICDPVRGYGFIRRRPDCADWSDWRPHDDFAWGSRMARRNINVTDGYGNRCIYRLLSVKLKIIPDDRHTGCDDFSDRSGKIITNGYPVYGFADSFANIGQGYIAGIIPIPVVIF